MVEGWSVYPGVLGSITVDRCATDSFFLIFTICLSAVFSSTHEVRRVYFANYVRLTLRRQCLNLWMSKDPEAIFKRLRNICSFCAGALFLLNIVAALR
jgi:hypothetical protein